MSDSSAELLQSLKAGEPDAAARIHARYQARLIHAARRRLSLGLARRLDPEDVLQSAWRSFFVHARAGEYSVERSGDLWKLLAAIVRHKALANVERHRAKRRDVARESSRDSILGDQADAVLNPAEEAALSETWAQVRALLPADDLRIFDLRLADYTHEEIAAATGRSERTIRRRLQAIQQRLSEDLPDAR